MAATAWEVESEVRVTANGGPLKVSLFVPEASRDLSVLDERVAAPDFGITIAPEGAQSPAEPHRPRRQRPAGGAPALLAASEPRARCRNAAKTPVEQQITLSQTAQTIARNLYASAHAKSSDDVSLVSVILRDLISPDRPENVRFLLGDDRSPQKVAALAAQILRVNDAHRARGARHRPRQDRHRGGRKDVARSLYQGSLAVVFGDHRPAARAAQLLRLVAGR